MRPRPFVDDVFEAVADLDPAARDASLHEWCAGYPSLEAEVRALLKADEQRRDELRPESTVGSYRLVERLGAGATATVWRAFDTHLQAWTALKVLHPRSGGALETVLREARAASAILSDYVVRIRTCGRTDEGVSFVDMQLCAEYVARDGGEQLVIGRSLADDPPLMVEEAVRLVSEACRGVEAAHRVGVLHRDLKPANVLVAPVSRRALVTDFGLAAAPLFAAPTIDTPPSATVSVRIDATDAVIVGTPPFMAPEVARGEAPSRTSDVYALGATLYALLAGRLPFVPSNQFSPVPALDIVEQVRRKPPAPLDEARRGERLPGRVPRRLARVVAKSMARDSRDRYPTAAALGADLESWAATHPTSLDRGPIMPVALFLVRHRPVVATASLLGAMLLFSAFELHELDDRRQVLEADVAAAEDRRSAAESQALAAEAVRAEAVAERDAAIREKEVAIADAVAAIEARNVAREGQTAAERRAEQEIRARNEAEMARIVAEARRDDAIEAMNAETALRRTLEQELAEAHEARAAADEERQTAEQARVRAEQALADTERALADAEKARLDAETNQRELESRLADELRRREQVEAERDAALAELVRSASP